MMRDVRLPTHFRMQGFNFASALREFEAAYNYSLVPHSRTLERMYHIFTQRAVNNSA